MKYLTLLCIALIGCQQKPAQHTATNCTVENTDSGAIIACPDGSRVPINDGKQGPIGPGGRDGRDGASCRAVPISTGIIVYCPNADPVVINHGHDGQDGTNATPVTEVQFCPEQGATTYGHFPEQGLCINNKILAVFFMGGMAFLAEVPPGAYVSTSTGLQCSFKVIQGCEVGK